MAVTIRQRSRLSAIHLYREPYLMAVRFSCLKKSGNVEICPEKAFDRDNII